MDAVEDLAFGDFEGRAWLNSAHQGPLPVVAAQAVAEATRRKQAPALMAEDDFAEVPLRLKTALGEMIGVPASEVVLGNSTTYGLHLLAHGLPLRPGDEILLVEGDFPATIVPWLRLRRRGVNVRLLRPASGVLAIDDLDKEVTARTRVVCASWVLSFTGRTVNVAALGEFCRDRDITFVVNASQAVGARPVDLSRLPVDALVSCGHKWLCGPYGTGFCWIRPDILARLTYEQPYWQHGQNAADLGGGWRYEFDEPPGAARYDMFAAASFLNSTALTASVRYLLGQGLEAIARHDQGLVERFVSSLDYSRYALSSPRSGPERSALVLVTHHNAAINPSLHELLRGMGVDVALRDGRLRLSPHLHNSPHDIDRALDVLNGTSLAR